MSEKITGKQFMIKLLNGMALGIVVALIPNAVLVAFLKPFAANPTVLTLMHALVMMQGLVGAVIGMMVALQFGMNPMKSAIVASVSFISGGVLHAKEGVKGLVFLGTGDLINIMIFTAIAVLVVMYVGDKLGSLTIVLLPIIGSLVGFVGLLCLPYVSMITKAIGTLILYFVSLQPLLMAVLITVSFAIIIISPISTVAIGLATGLVGLSSGAANMGVTVGAAVLVIGSLFVKNKSGVTLAVFLGAMKMMLPNIARHPIMYLPLVLTSIVSGIGVRYIGIVGTPQTAGFGIVGLIGPIQAYQKFVEQGASMPIVRILLAYLIIPFGAALIFHILFTRVFKVYSDDIYKFEN